MPIKQIQIAERLDFFSRLSAVFFFWKIPIKKVFKRKEEFPI